MEDANFKNAFYYINSYKRHRALFNIEKAKGSPNREEMQYHELKMYQFFDSLELALRALQSEHREEEK